MCIANGSCVVVFFLFFFFWGGGGGGEGGKTFPYENLEDSQLCSNCLH